MGGCDGVKVTSYERGATMSNSLEVETVPIRSQTMTKKMITATYHFSFAESV